MFRTNTCGELRMANVGQEVTLSGWVQRVRDKGALVWIDLRDRYGITQLRVDDTTDASVSEVVAKLGREYVIQATGVVEERQSKNAKIATGDIEISLKAVKVLNASEVPPFTIEDESDGGEDIRAKYRYLDLRRNPLKNALMLRHRMAHEARNYLDGKGFLEIETPFLIKSTPEGARDFVVPSRMNPGEFYALPQSPQTFKQLLMVAGYDRYFQIVRCFRDEDLRADRQPEFTQIDCEMSFVEQEDVLNLFEGMMRHLFKEVIGVEIANSIPRMSWFDAMDRYGSDKPDIRFGMEIHEITPEAKGHDFSVFDSVEYVGAICVPGAAGYTRKQTDELTEWVKRPQVGAKGLVTVRYNEDGSFKSSVDKFFSQEDLADIACCCQANPGDLILVLCGSVSSWIKDEIIDNGSYMGRRSLDVVVPELPLKECVKFWGKAVEKWSVGDILDMLSVTGGVPRYLEEIETSLSPDENIKRLCFMPNAVLRMDFDEMFTDVITREQKYTAEVLRCLVNGPRSVSEIATMLGVEKGGRISAALMQLVEAGFASPDAGKNPETGADVRELRYRLKDNYARFYLKFVEPVKSVVDAGSYAFSGMDQFDGWETVLGLQFENLVLNNYRDLLPRLHFERVLIHSAARFPSRARPPRPAGSCNSVESKMLLYENVFV